MFFWTFTSVLMAAGRNPFGQSLMNFWRYQVPSVMCNVVAQLFQRLILQRERLDHITMIKYMNVLQIPRARAWRFFWLIAAFSAVSLLSYVLLFNDAHLKAQTSPVLSTVIETGSHSDEYGFRQSNHRSYGSIGGDRFDYDSSAGKITFVIEYIRWDDDTDKLELGLQECLKSADFMGFVLGSTTYSVPDRAGIDDDLCDEEPFRFQEFEFHDIATNPFPENDGDSIVFELFVRGATTTITETATQTTTIINTSTVTATATSTGTTSSSVNPHSSPDIDPPDVDTGWY